MKSVTWRPFVNNDRAGYEHGGLWQHGQNKNTESQLALYSKFPLKYGSHSQ